MGYFRNDIGADTVLDEYFDSGMNSGVDIYDTAHREGIAVALSGDKTGCGGVALLLALEVGVKLTLVGDAWFRTLYGGSGKQCQ